MVSLKTLQLFLSRRYPPEICSGVKHQSHKVLQTVTCDTQKETLECFSSSDQLFPTLLLQVRVLKKKGLWNNVAMSV